MPIRAFVSQNIDQLKVTLAALETALQSGSVQELRNNRTGFLVGTGAITQETIQLRYNQCRYELYLRVQCLPKDDPNRCALQQLYTNPYVEKGMRVNTRFAVGVFGYPLPAPLVPPEP